MRVVHPLAFISHKNPHCNVFSGGPMYKPSLKRSDSDIPDVTYERRIIKYLPPDMTDQDWEDIIDIFMEIDSERRGYISRNQLVQYFRNNRIPEYNTDKWFEWFESENEGIITMEDICTTLGIPMRHEYIQKVDRKRSMISQGLIPMPEEAPKMFAVPPVNPSPPPPPPNGSSNIIDGVEVLHTNAVPDDMLKHCIRLVKDYPSTFREEQEMASYLKEHMERYYRRYWQVIIASSTIGCVVAHEAKMFIHFKHSNRIYILYRTPDPTAL